MINDRDEFGISDINLEFMHFLEAMKNDKIKYPPELEAELFFAFDAAEGGAESSTSRYYQRIQLMTEFIEKYRDSKLLSQDDFGYITYVRDMNDYFITNFSKSW